MAMHKSYKPELDDSPELDSENITYFQELIGILRWAIEIGRVDILTEVSMLSASQASPREGHLKALLQIFTYILRSIIICEKKDSDFSMSKHSKMGIYFLPKTYVCIQ